MARSELVAGLDLGTTRTCCVLAEIGPDGEIMVIGVGVSRSHGLRKGVVVDIDATARSVEEAAQRAAQMAGREMPPVHVGITGEHISSLNSKGITAISHADREINEADRLRVLQQSRVVVIPADRAILHAIARSYSVDGQEGIRQPVGMYGSRLEVETHIVTGSQTFLLNVEKCVSRAGLVLDDIVLGPLATAEAVVMPEEKDLGVAVLDIGGGTTDLALFQDGEIYYSASIPVGGQHVTSDIAQLLRVSLDEAERIKIDHGSAMPGGISETDTVPVVQIGWPEPRPFRRRGLCEIIEARQQELFGLVKKEIGRSGRQDRLSAGVVVTGGGALLDGSTECAAQALHMPVRLGVPRGIAGLADRVAGPEFAASVGLVRFALRGIEEQRSSAPSDWWSGVVRALSRLVGLFRPR